MKIKWHYLLSLSLLMLIVLVCTIPLKTLAQNPQVITGTVVNRTKEALPGVSVKVKNTTTAIVTDSKGKFSIPARSNDILVFSYVGYQPQEVTVGTTTTMDIVLQESVTSLDEVVVVGYGTSTKRDITGSITSATSKQIEERSPINVFDAIQGQAPSVQISQEDGRAGAGSSVIIRGIGTLGANAQPLYIVDGAQGVTIGERSASVPYY